MLWLIFDDDRRDAQDRFDAAVKARRILDRSEDQAHIEIATTTQDALDRLRRAVAVNDEPVILLCDLAGADSERTLLGARFARVVSDDSGLKDRVRRIVWTRHHVASVFGDAWPYIHAFVAAGDLLPGEDVPPALASAITHALDHPEDGAALPFPQEIETLATNDDRVRRWLAKLLTANGGPAPKISPRDVFYARHIGWRPDISLLKEAKQRDLTATPGRLNPVDLKNAVRDARTLASVKAGASAIVDKNRSFRVARLRAELTREVTMNALLEYDEYLRAPMSDAVETKDVGGLRQTWDAWLERTGLTPELAQMVQVFFVSFEKVREALGYARQNGRGLDRCLGVVIGSPTKAFADRDAALQNVMDRHGFGREDLEYAIHRINDVRSGY